MLHWYHQPEKSRELCNAFVHVNLLIPGGCPVEENILDCCGKNLSLSEDDEQMHDGIAPRFHNFSKGGKYS